MRAVLDANVFISALLSPEGPPARLLTRWLAGEFELVVSDRLLGELEDALRRPKLRTRITDDETRALIALLREVAHVALDVQDPPPRSADADDDYLIALAETQSAVLVSGDAAVLALTDRFPIRAPRRFLEVLDQRAG